MRMNLDADAITGTGSLADNNWLATGWIAVRKRWWLVVGITMAAALVAILYLRNADYLYTATLRVSPAPSTQQPRVGLYQVPWRLTQREGFPKRP